MSTKAVKDLSGDWKIHTPQLFNEIVTANPTTWMLAVPVQLLADKLAMVAQRAIELQDKKLLKLCCDLTLLEESDPKSKNYDPELVARLKE